MVKCNKCGKLKNITEYRNPSINKCGTKGICKACKNKADKIYWEEKYTNREFREKHDSRQWKYKEQKREYQKEYDFINRKRKHEYMKNCYNTNPEFKTFQLIRTRIWHALKAQNKNKLQSTIELLGCSIKEYKCYLEKQFNENMSWDNHGNYWEIDHIIPLNQGGSFYYKNTRPLEVSKNRKRKKGKRRNNA